MDTYVSGNTPFSKRGIRPVLLFAALVLGFLTGFLLVQTPAAPARPPALASDAGKAASRRQYAHDVPDAPPPDVVVYYLVATEDDKRVVEDILSTSQTGSGTGPARTHVVAVVASEEAEAQLTRTIEEANTQTSAYGEPGFRIVDLR